MIGTIIDSVRVSTELGLFVVTLREQQGKRSLHIFVESDEAKAIAAALDNRVVPELGIYDLLRLVIEGLSARVGMIVVSDCNRVKDRASLDFDAKILVVDDVKKFTIVSHAQDAIVIAILTRTPIFVEESVMDISCFDELTQARINELSWLEVKNSFEFESKELPSPKQLNRMLSSQETVLTGTEVKLDVSSVGSLLLHYQNFVLLSDQQRNCNLAILMGYSEANTIAELVQNTTPLEPHHLLYKIIEGCSSRVNMVVIHKLRESGVRAKLIYESGDRRFGVECRPSDAIAVALVAKAPIYASESAIVECRSFTDLVTAVTENDKFASNQKEVESLISLVNPPPWKFWVSTKKQEEAVKRLLEISISAPDFSIRQAAVKALQTFHANH
jgi:bifunctional DNase/RNase